MRPDSLSSVAATRTVRFCLLLFRSRRERKAEEASDDNHATIIRISLAGRGVQSIACAYTRDLVYGAASELYPVIVAAVRRAKIAFRYA